MLPSFMEEVVQQVEVEGRGGGPIQATLKSQPPNTVNGKIRITDQGEVIQQNLIEKMSDISKSSYRKNINQSSDFIKYFKTVTPHVSLGKLSIGSRPSKRKNIDNIKGLRAIPWVFAWTQIRLMLPAWLGSAEALRYSSIEKFEKTLFNDGYLGYGNFKSGPRYFKNI